MLIVGLGALHVGVLVMTLALAFAVVVVIFVLAALVSVEAIKQEVVLVVA